MVDDAVCSCRVISTGSPQLDTLLTGLFPGDNVVWQVDSLDEYIHFVALFARQAVNDGRKCIYLRFAGHEPLLKNAEGITIATIDPSPGFDSFSRKVHEIIKDSGEQSCFVFDNLSALVNCWATDELLADFYQVTCPYIYELKGIAYFALNRDQHDYSAIARIKTTTQILLSIYRVGARSYIHPLKVWKRYSANMFLVHLMSGTQEWVPITTSYDAAAVLTASGKNLIRTLPDSNSPWNTVYRKLAQYEGCGEHAEENQPEINALKAEMIRMMFGEHVMINRLADSYLGVGDLLMVRRRLIGSGRIGGKSAGMLLARKVLLCSGSKVDFSQILEEHDSFYIGSDVFFSFLVNNNLFRLRLNMSRKSDCPEQEFEEIEQAFLRGAFPEEIMAQLRDMLDHYGQSPIIVRSSSLLEDGFQHAYAGKYRSEFCANQGSPEERLSAFLRALKLVYSSALNPDVVSYREKMGITEGDEQMAILVQRVSGMPYGNYFFPTLAGVAFSHNLYAWSERIDPEKGMVRMVFGLGTRAVNRIGGDYPRMISVSSPALRPESPDRIARYSQRKVDLIDLEKNEFLTETVEAVLGSRVYPNMELLASSFSESYEHDLALGNCWQSCYRLTFRNLLQRTDFIPVMNEILSTLEKAWGQAVDIEFTAHIKKENCVKINLLQCRALKIPGYSGKPHSSLNKEGTRKVLFRSCRAMGAGIVENIRYIIYVPAEQYASLEIVKKRQVGRIIGKLNGLLSSQPGSIMLIGPGRWGSANIDLGINVNFADISGISALVEIAFEPAGFAPEVSYGTHFFLDLVEAGILYVPLYPEEGGFLFDSDFFNNGSDVLNEFVPEYAEFNGVIRVIDISKMLKQSTATLLVNPEEKSAEFYLT